MYSCGSVIVGIALALTPVSGLVAESSGTQLANTAFQDWTGTLDQTTLPDKSVLSAYIAHTFSGNTPGASLQVSFLPRFSCNPMISIVLDASETSLENVQVLYLLVDETELELPVLVDEGRSGRLLSYNADHIAHLELRELLDFSNRAIVRWTSGNFSAGAVQDADVAGTEPQAAGVTFSLLGSRMSVDAVETHCQSHEPIPHVD